MNAFSLIRREYVRPDFFLITEGYASAISYSFIEFWHCVHVTSSSRTRIVSQLTAKHVTMQYYVRTCATSITQPVKNVAYNYLIKLMTFQVSFCLRFCLFFKKKQINKFDKVKRSISNMHYQKNNFSWRYPIFLLAVI